MDKETIKKILAYVEKNCTEVEEVEEYLWRLLDEKKNESIVIGESFTFLFEGKNNNYDKEYAEYIEDSISEVNENKGDE